MTDRNPSSSEVRVGERRPGGRAARVRASVLQATLGLLDEIGYDALGTDEVARRAGVHRTTVYRRWPTKSELVADAVALGANEAIPIPDTGDLVDDLLALARAVTANLANPEAANRTRSMVAAAATSDALSTSLHRFMLDRVTQSEPIVERAVARGDLPPGADARVVIQPIIGAIWFRFLLTGEMIDDDFLRSIVEMVSAGAMAAGPGLATTDGRSP